MLRFKGSIELSEGDRIIVPIMWSLANTRSERHNGLHRLGASRGNDDRANRAFSVSQGQAYMLTTIIARMCACVVGNWLATHAPDQSTARSQWLWSLRNQSRPYKQYKKCVAGWASLSSPFWRLTDYTSIFSSIIKIENNHGCN